MTILSYQQKITNIIGRTSHWVEVPAESHLRSYIGSLMMMDGIQYETLLEAAELSRTEETFAQMIHQLMKKRGQKTRSERYKQKYYGGKQHGKR